MKHQLFVLTLVLNFFSAFAQEIEILQKSDSIPNIKEKGLVYINEKTDLTDYYFIAKLKITSDDFNKILIALQRTAIDLSANAFKYIGKQNLGNRTVVILDLFAANPKLVALNGKNNQTNVVYLFGNDNKTQSFRINNQRIVLQPNEMYRVELPKDREVKINKGGLTGMTVFHHWQENQPVIFYAFGSGNVTTSGNEVGSLGFTINTGNFMELKSDFAQLLVELKK